MYIKSVENVKGNYICDLYNENNIKIIKTFKKLIEKVKFITYTIDMGASCEISYADFP